MALHLVMNLSEVMLPFTNYDPKMDSRHHMGFELIPTHMYTGYILCIATGYFLDTHSNLFAIMCRTYLWATLCSEQFEAPLEVDGHDPNASYGSKQTNSKQGEKRKVTILTLHTAWWCLVTQYTVQFTCS